MTQFCCREEQILVEHRGISIVSCFKLINYSQFVDDTLLLGGASVMKAHTFKLALDTSIGGSDGQINKTQSHIYD